MTELIQRFRDWDLHVRRLAEQAEARIADGNILIADLYRSGRTKPWVLLGPVMSLRPYEAGCGPDDSAQVTQAMLLIPEGLGIAFWDAEDFHAYPDGPPRWAEARRRFVPIADCQPLLRVQFLPFAAELIARVARHTRRR